MGLSKQLDPDQAVSSGAFWEGSALFASPSESFGHITALDCLDALLLILKII